MPVAGDDVAGDRWGFAVGSGGIVLRTEDGGLSWQDRSENFGAQLLEGAS